MNPKLQPITIKVDRANEHFEDFKGELGIGPRARERRLGVHSVHYEPNWTHVEWEAKYPKVRPEAGLILGDALHQLRSSLDHVMSQLVFQRTKSRSDQRRAQFPIFTEEPEFLNFKKYPRVKFLADTFGPRSPEFAAIQQSQPYKRHPGAASTDELWILHELNNIDKHRAILILDNRNKLVVTAFSADERYSHRTDFGKQPVTSGTKVMRFDWPHPVPPSKVDVDDMSDFVVFTETDGLCDDMSVFPMFRRIVAAVNETIAKFECCF